MALLSPTLFTPSVSAETYLYDRDFVQYRYKRHGYIGSSHTILDAEKQHVIFSVYVLCVYRDLLEQAKELSLDLQSRKVHSNARTHTPTHIGSFISKIMSLHEKSI